MYFPRKVHIRNVSNEGPAFLKKQLREAAGLHVDSSSSNVLVEIFAVLLFCSYTLGYCHRTSGKNPIFAFKIEVKLGTSKF